MHPVRIVHATLLAFAALLAGCKSSGEVKRDEWGGAQNCHFAGVTRQDFETALHRVFAASGPKVYGLRPAEGGALVEQHWALDVVFASAAGVERWQLEYAPAGDGVDVHVEVERAPGPIRAAGGKDTALSGRTSDYHLLWSRIEYVLGKHGDWPRCESWSSLPRSGLCSADSSAAPPLKLARSR